jgi:hypothetical protein
MPRNSNMACFSLVVCGQKGSSRSPSSDAPTLLTSRAKTVPTCMQKSKNAARVQWEARPGVVEQATEVMSDSFQRSGRQATPAPSTLMVPLKSGGKTGQHVQWAMEVESVHSISKDLDTTPTASVASARQSGRKATPAPSSFKLPFDEPESDYDKQRVQWATDIESVHSIPKDADTTPTACVASARQSGRKATPAPSSFKLPVDESESDDDKQHVHWAREVESIHSIPKDLDTTPIASVASSRQSGRKATPAPSSFKLPLDESESDSDKPHVHWAMKMESVHSIPQTPKSNANESASWLYKLLPAWPSCDRQPEERAHEILIQ